MEAEAWIVAMSKRTAVVRIDVTNGGRVVGAAQGTVAIMPPKAGSPVAPEAGSLADGPEAPERR